MTRSLKRITKLDSSTTRKHLKLSETETEHFELHGECGGDPQGYFIIKGTEKVVLMQEQLCRNKVLMEPDWKRGILQASCASATLETKSKVGILLKNNRLWVKSSSFKELIPLPVMLKAMGCHSDKLIFRMCNVVPFRKNNSAKPANANPNSEKHDRDAEQSAAEEFQLIMFLSFEETLKLGVNSQTDAIEFLSGKIRYLFKSMENRPKEQRMLEVWNILSKIILPHVAAPNLDFKDKITFVAHMTRKLIRYHLQVKSEGKNAPGSIANNRDYLGNKRVECAGEMLSLLFEDLFKRFNSELKKELDKFLGRAKKKARDPDSVHTFIKMICSSDTITNGLKHALSSGNWSIKR